MPSTPDLVIKAHDTYPPLVTVLAQNGALIDLANATAIKVELKGATVLVTGTCSKPTVATITGTTASGSPVITGVSSFAAVINGGSITGPGIPPLTRVGLFDSAAGTINLIGPDGNAVNATAPGTGVSFQINKGTVQYTWVTGDTAVVDTYNVEHEITWSGGGIQTVPNSGYNTVQIVQDLENS